ncbi:DUF2252 domain-containing protein [Streptomyces sp. ODS28]|uniref:DUF2252 domain-containing protein n=1 Tax=Streptomyces sp. ODS28 TaxID=3136688 RepID=UPI0031E6ED5A
MTWNGNPPRTAGERAAHGKAVRTRVPRAAHAEYAPRPGRPDPVSVLEEHSASRVPELVPLRYGRMLESPFRFLRGAAALMAADLAGTPATGLTAQLCGDAHLLNFRLLASPERHLLFDINDFDETLSGPWEWDVKRLSASLAVAGRANGFTDKQRAAVLRAAVRSYREAMIGFSGMRHLEVWYAHTDADELYTAMAGELGAKARERLSRTLTRARSRDHLQAYARLTHRLGGARRIAADPPLVVPASDLLPETDRHRLDRQLRGLVERYAHSLSADRASLLRQYRVVDMARKVVGVGSVGTRCWIILLLGRDEEDPLLLQAKEAGESVLAPHTASPGFQNQGERVVTGQRLMQAASDIFLGWERVEGIDGRQRDFYVRQLRDWKAIPQADVMSPRTMRLFGEVCGTALARAHARSGDRIAIAAYLGRGQSFEYAVAEFAERYADQNESDHDALARAAKDGRITTAAG